MSYLDDPAVPLDDPPKRKKRDKALKHRNSAGLKYPSEIIKKRSLTHIERKVILARVKNPSDTLAEVGAKAGINGTGASRGNRVSGILRKEKIQRSLKAIMDARPDLDQGTLLNKLAEGLEAKRHVVVGSGESAVVEAVPDMQTQKGFLEMAFKMRGELTPSEEDSQGGWAAKVNLALIIVEERRKRGLAPIDLSPDDVTDVTEPIEEE